MAIFRECALCHINKCNIIARHQIFFGTPPPPFKNQEPKSPTPTYQLSPQHPCVSPHPPALLAHPLLLPLFRQSCIRRTHCTVEAAWLVRNELQPNRFWGIDRPVTEEDHLFVFIYTLLTYDRLEDSVRDPQES